jgi:hypothetical protein
MKFYDESGSSPQKSKIRSFWFKEFIIFWASITALERAIFSCSGFEFDLQAPPSSS